MADVEEGKTMAIIAYLTWIGLIIAIVMNLEKKNEFAKFHIRQSLLLMIVGFVAWIPIVGWILGLLALVAWIMGLIYAIKGEQKEVFLFGKYAQEWFKSI